MNTLIKPLESLMTPEIPKVPAGWQLRCIQSEQCLSYLAWNEDSHEALVVDPKLEDHEAYLSLARTLQGYRWIAVVDTHTHADHVSVAARLAEELRSPLVMHALAPSPRVQLRVSRTTELSSQASPVRFYPTPGHTPDSLTVVWGPFVFGGDTVLYGDSGRDDLPGGDPAAHYESLQLLKQFLTPGLILLPGHDHKGGRASTWAKQLEVNASLTQGREEFVAESSAFDAPAPELLKKSLRENFK